jgi:hypothetical protein
VARGKKAKRLIGYVGSLPWELASPLSAIRVRGPVVAQDEELSNTAG